MEDDTRLAARDELRHRGADDVRVGVGASRVLEGVERLSRGGWHRVTCGSHRVVSGHMRSHGIVWGHLEFSSALRAWRGAGVARARDGVSEREGERAR
eukprot:1537851-Prymnesium_polylepis.1